MYDPPGRALQTWERQRRLRDKLIIVWSLGRSNPVWSQRSRDLEVASDNSEIESFETKNHTSFVTSLNAIAVHDFDR